MSSDTADEELTLPKATVLKIISEMLPPDMQCAKETRELLTDCCVEFIHLISSEANDICEKDSRKTISPDHVITALKELGFEDFVKEVQGSWGEHKEVQKERSQRSERLRKTDLSSEEMARHRRKCLPKLVRGCSSSSRNSHSRRSENCVGGFHLLWSNSFHLPAFCFPLFIKVHTCGPCK
ncbi:histone-fold-containing protein [Catenaria anguillulae PL171]|uniref:Histone-fold-containing protein n=1 Tax=Catenaria anguillulae PL171 TaxID=765915 RepID=A0A1Y2HWB4_9FUNG|nr:histone-fold-containing protein [Catenaria anguillulae PL171]